MASVPCHRILGRELDYETRPLDPIVYRAGAIITVDGNAFVDGDFAMTEYNPHRDVVREAVSRMIGIALDALVDSQS